MARIDLGLAERDFWALTLREFSKLLERRMHRDFSAAKFYALVLNAWTNAETRPRDFSPDDFVPPYFHATGEPAEQEEGSTDNRAARAFAKVRALVAMFQGDDETEHLQIEFPSIMSPDGTDR